MNRITDLASERQANDVHMGDRAMRNSGLVTSRELADRFGVTVETVQSWVRRGRIPCIRPSRRVVRFDMEDVEHSIAQPSQKEDSHVHA